MKRTRVAPSVRKRAGRKRWPAIAAGAIAAVMIACGAMATAATVPAAPAATPETVGPLAPQQAVPPVPSIGAPYFADQGSGRIAEVTIKTATFTSPGVLTLDVAWDSWVGVTTPDPATFQVLDGTGARAKVHPLTDGSIPLVDVQPGHPAHGLVAFDIPTGPATLVIKPSGAQTATRITIKD